jgi:hypothetical protein
VENPPFIFLSRTIIDINRKTFGEKDYTITDPLLNNAFQPVGSTGQDLSLFTPQNNGACGFSRGANAVAYTWCFEISVGYWPELAGNNNEPPPPPPPTGGGAATAPDPCGNKQIVNGNLPAGCGGTQNGWEPDLDDEVPDSNGFYYSKKMLLSSLLNNPYAVLPCDSLPILNQFGQMYQSVGNYVVPQIVQNRLDSIKNAIPNFDTSSLFIQTLNNGASTVVNCDFFPVKINLLPFKPGTGNRYTPSEFLEFFRKNMNIFSTSNAVFGPYNSGALNDSLLYYKDTINSLGAVVHIDMLQDGSVILSRYRNSYFPSSYQSHSFIFSTLVTPLDGYHPVSGNREFGIHTDNSGGFTFYTMGVDRISKNAFVFGSFIQDALLGNSGFDDADQLWTSMQENMINYINIHGGTAINYTRRNFIVRPKYDKIKDYLNGTITYQQLLNILCP